MSPIIRRFWILTWLIPLLLIQACSTSPMEETKTSPVASLSPHTPRPAATVSPIKSHANETVESSPDEETMSESVLIYAVDAVASSSASDPGYQPAQAQGAPNTFACGDFVTAWQPAAREQKAWIELSYFPYILPNDLTLTQSYYPGQIMAIEVLTLDEDWMTVYDASQTPLPDISDICPVARIFETPAVEVLIQTVRIHLGRSPEEPWTQIDSVGVNGWISDNLPDPIPAVDNAENISGDIFGSTFFTNRNRVNSVTFEGENLWAATQGGLLYYDLSTSEIAEPITVSPLAANAVTVCEWNIPLLAVGNARGVATFPLPSWDPRTGDIHESSPLQPLDHPGEDDFGIVQTLACDTENNYLWVGYTDHLSRYDPHNQTWKEYSWRDGLPEGSIRALTLLGEDLWIASSSGAAVLRANGELKAFTPENSSVPGQYVHSIIPDASGTLWMVTSDGLASFDGVNWTHLADLKLHEWGLSSQLIGLASDLDGSLWVADVFGALCRLDSQTQDCSEIQSPPTNSFNLDSLLVSPQGEITVVSQLDGLYQLKKDAWQFLGTDDLLSSNFLRAMVYTPDGHIWLATDRGVQHFPASQPSSEWYTEDLPNDAMPFSFFVAHDGLWIGHSRGARFLPYLQNEAVIDLLLEAPETGLDTTVTAITRDAEGRVYLGLSAGLFIWDGSQVHFHDLRSKQTSYPPRVYTLFADGDVVWVGTSNGLNKFVKGFLTAVWNQVPQNASAIGSPSIGVIAADPRSEGMLVSIGLELFSFKQGSFERVLQLPSEIRSLYVGPYQLWLATANKGFYSVPMDDTEQIYWESASHYESLPNSAGYQAFTPSGPHTLWIATEDNGLVRLVAMWGQ